MTNVEHAILNFDIFIDNYPPNEHTGFNYLKSFALSQYGIELTGTKYVLNNKIPTIQGKVVNMDKFVLAMMIPDLVIKVIEENHDS